MVKQAEYISHQKVEHTGCQKVYLGYARMEPKREEKGKAEKKKKKKPK